ncbi:UNVERIFIED_CONTAM: Berberine bridge enzyme-like 23 [Sesamum calycinum]|uniref:Berberine bridge enzyme-like 23 n=1 Tax=Sesamum calycinum TaxID=2727403 RepID=A0AAW2QZG8_9LAMI
MRNFRSVLINTKDKTAWVEVGTTLGQLYHTIARHSKTLAFPAGVCPTVGVGGHISGGGYGMMSRKYSIASDHIIDAKVMNADGHILDRRSMGEDLFWAIRGGGGTSFGIVLAFKLQLVTIPDTYIADKIDPNIMVRLFLRSITSPIHGNRTIEATFNTLYLGRLHKLLPIMQEKFPELGLVQEDCFEMSWIESVLYFTGLRNESLDILLSGTLTSLYGPIYSKCKSDYVRQPIPVSGLRGIWRFLHEEDENMAELQFSPYGGAMNDYSESETPVAHRAGYIFMIHYAVSWTSPGNSESERHITWIRRLYAYMALTFRRILEQLISTTGILT